MDIYSSELACEGERQAFDSSFNGDSNVPFVEYIDSSEVGSFPPPLYSPTVPPHLPHPRGCPPACILLVVDLGWDNSESYGVSYKARGLCKTLSNLDIFDDDQPFDYAVYGDIKNSELHHNVRGLLGRARYYSQLSMCLFEWTQTSEISMF